MQYMGCNYMEWEHGCKYMYEEVGSRYGTGVECLRSSCDVWFSSSIHVHVW